MNIQHHATDSLEITGNLEVTGSARSQSARIKEVWVYMYILLTLPIDTPILFILEQDYYTIKLLKNVVDVKTIWWYVLPDFTLMLNQYDWFGICLSREY